MSHNKHVAPDAPAFIYVMIDPRNGKPFYVGQTARTLERRLLEHIQHSERSRTNLSCIATDERIWAITDAGLMPIMVVIQTTIYEEATFWEGMWIDRLIADGYTLVNTRPERPGQFKPRRQTHWLIGSIAACYHPDTGEAVRGIVLTIEFRNGKYSQDETWYELRTEDGKLKWESQDDCFTAWKETPTYGREGTINLVKATFLKSA